MAFNRNILLLGCIFLLNIAICIKGNRVFDKIYEEIQSEMVCFKRLNGTHEIGCTSDFWGNVGIIQLIEEPSNLTWVLEKGSHPPYVLAILPTFLTVEILQEASQSGKVSGIIVLASANYTILSHFSGERTCPNKQSSLYINSSYDEYCDNKPWNPYGSGLLFMKWDFPIFFINKEKSIEDIISCYNKYNKPDEFGNERNYPLCAVELHSSMYAATNSEVCLRRSEDIITLTNLCEPLEDINVWGSIFPLNASYPLENKSVIIVSTAADSISLFDVISPGADVAISGLVTLLITAEALFKHVPMDNLLTDKNILFSIFEGEAWDYIGSSRMVYDMINNNFPLKNDENINATINQVGLHHIDSIIDIKQVGIITKEKEKKVLFLHTDPLSNRDEDISQKTNDLINNLINESTKWNISLKKVSINAPLPPSSMQSFLKEMNISGVVLTDHEKEYQNPYYMSIYDNDINVNYLSINGSDENDVLYKDIANIASILASSLYKMITGEEKYIKADAELSNKLFYCYLKNMNCTYFQKMSDLNLKTFLKPAPATTFVSIKRANNPLPTITLRLLSKYMGKEVDLNETECIFNNTQLMNYVYYPYLGNGTCIESSVHSSSALSPAFVIENYDWKSSKYSTWTESTWYQNEARIFLRPSPSEEIGLLIGGVISILSSIFVVYFLNSRASIIFDSQIPAQC